jgi:transposase
VNIKKAQQSCQRGFAFVKDPLLFADSIFLKSPERIESLGMIMGLCLLVYTLGERQIRTPSRESKSTVKINWVNQLTAPLYAVFLHAFSLFI